MSWDNPNFAEGDSGVPMPTMSIQIWNEIEAAKRQEAEGAPATVSLDIVAFLAEVGGRAMAIACNKSNDPLARATALEVARKAMMNQLQFERSLGAGNERLA